MAEVILICGKICSGKSTCARQLRCKKSAAVLSVDEITLSLFDQQIGDMHDVYAERAKEYLFKKSLELLESGINVILDWGFWTKTERDYAKAFYRERNIPCQLYYIDISDEVWHSRLQKRNAAVLAGETSAYYVDDNLAAKFAGIFEPPEGWEIDVQVK